MSTIVRSTPTWRLALWLLAAVTVMACGAGAATTPTSQPAAGKPGAPVQGAPGGAPIDSAPARSSGDPASNIPPTVRVERQVQLTLQIANGSFNSSLSDVFGVINREGGYPVGAATPSTGERVKTGTFSFKVKAENFDDTVASLRKLGTLQNFGISGQDVSQQYVDLQARLVNQQRQRDALLTLLGQARTVQETIAIQQQLGVVTEQIERLEGQIKYLDSVTNYATFAVTLVEAPPVGAAPDEWGFKSALGQGLHNLVAVLSWMVLLLGYALPLLVIGGPLGIWLWRRRRQPSRREAPAA
jgi:hypothetical protein